MPKLKTNRAAAKRFRVTGRGKIARRQAGTRHMLLSKSRTRKRRLGRFVLVSGADAGSVRRMLGRR